MATKFMWCAAAQKQTEICQQEGASKFCAFFFIAYAHLLGLRGCRRCELHFRLCLLRNSIALYVPLAC